MGKKTKKKNDISEITNEKLDSIRNELFFGYQHNWHKHKDERTRFILKSRLIGATYYFAWEAFEDAVLTGDNQVFLSASRKQADVFKAYIIKFAQEYFDIELKVVEERRALGCVTRCVYCQSKPSNKDCEDCGTEINDVIELKKDGKPWAELRFVSTVKDYYGHLYIDEVFWIPDFEKRSKVATASQKRWRETYFSTPSVKNHGAFPLWSGEKFNKDRKNKVEFDLKHETLKHGFTGPDNIWRNIVTIVDAEEQGCDLFDIEQLKIEYTKAVFNNLFMCAFRGHYLM